jgi:hypothetical protein
MRILNRDPDVHLTACFGSGVPNVPPKEIIMARKWTVMVYLAGDSRNNLSAEMIFALKQMKEVKDIGEDKKVNVVALFDPCGEKYPTEVYAINSRGSKSLKDDLKRGTGINADKTNVKHSVISFAKWAIAQYEAEHFMLVLSGHGSGAEGDYFLPDQNPVSALRIDDLTEIVQEINKQRKGKHLEIIGMDSCLTSMAETCHALCNVNNGKFENHVDYLIGAEGYTPLTGWPYKEIFQAMADMAANSHDADPLKIARMVVHTYAQYYVDYTRADVCVDLAAVHLNHYGAVAESIKDLAEHFTTELKNNTWLARELIQLAHLKVQSYLDRSYADLWDFCDCLSGLCYTKTRQHCKKVKEAVDKMVRAHKHLGEGVENSNGLAICLPWTPITAQYKKLKFAQYTQWSKFLEKYLSQSGRIMGRTPQDFAPIGKGGGPVKNGPERFLLAEDGVRPSRKR